MHAFARKLKKVYTLGLRKSAQVFLCRLNGWYYGKKLRLVSAVDWRHRSVQGVKRKFSKEFYEHLDGKNLIMQADAYAHNCFDILGSSMHCFVQIPWQTDFKLRNSYPSTTPLRLRSGRTGYINLDFFLNWFTPLILNSFPIRPAKSVEALCEDWKRNEAKPNVVEGNERSNTFPKKFYKDITIPLNQSRTLQKDIKVPWELSRFYHLYVLGKAFQITGNQKYKDTFVEHIADWQQQNPFLYGVNWMCPMEVGIRAINWVWGYNFFCDVLNEKFKQNFINSLYDHMYYLEHNWEWYDGRTSNHYLSDLVGYFYLCWFFKDLAGMHKKREWCYQEILSEFNKQVQEDGTSYEGSTAYHRLVTELLYHFKFVCDEFGLILPEWFETTLQKMFTFLAWCSYAPNTLVTIGDNDSGKILFNGLPKIMPVTQQNITGIKEFKNFGLSVYKTKNVHFTLRHHAHNNKQPSGHFHNDVGSITLALHGVPIFIDPGSFVYTPSAEWRNYFRSIKVHNTFYIKGREPVALDERLFALDMPANVCNDEPFMMEHNLYHQLNVRARREVSINENLITIADQWTGTTHHNVISGWNFTLAPDIEAHKINHAIILCYNNKKLLELYSEDLDFEIKDTWVSYEYGKKVNSKRLICYTPLQEKTYYTSLYF